jgi:hypothetical protein
MFVSVLSFKPRNSEVWAVDSRTWRVIKKFKDIGPDSQTMAVGYDGKYVFQIYSRFQRLSSVCSCSRRTRSSPWGSSRTSAATTTASSYRRRRGTC